MPATSTLTPLLKLTQLKKSYDEGQSWAVNQIDLDITAGEIVCLLGPSGCGKTTLLRMIAGLEEIDSGQVEFHGQNVANVPAFQRGFGMMFQNFALFPHKNVFENVAFGLRMQQKSAAEIEGQVSKMLELVGLSGYATRAIDHLSGGEQQRVALARTLAPGPKLIMLDEPLGSLDRALREQLMLELRQILKQVGVTTISVTHDQTEAFAIADKIVVMNKGKIEQIAPPEQLYNYPKSLFVARFLGYKNLLPATIKNDESEDENARIITAVGEFSADQTPRSTTIHPSNPHLLIRPTAATIHSQPAPNSLPMRVHSVSFRGRYYQIELNGPNQHLTFEPNQLNDITVGQEVHVEIDPTDSWLLS